MNTLKFREIFLKLHPRKKAIVREYCRLYEDANLSPDALVDRIFNVWNRAAGDSKLTTCLQLADYIYADVDEDKDIDADERAYLCEHLMHEVGLDLEETKQLCKSSPSDLPESSEAESFILQCPNGSYVTVIGNTSKDTNAPDSLREWICSQCQQPFEKHRIVRPRVVSPDS